LLPPMFVTVLLLASTATGDVSAAPWPRMLLSKEPPYTAAGATGPTAASGSSRHLYPGFAPRGNAGHAMATLGGQQCLDWDRVFVRAMPCVEGAQQGWRLGTAAIPMSQQRRPMEMARILQTADGHCLDDGGRLVHVWRCNGTTLGVAQTWFYDPILKYIRNFRGLCLQASHAQGPVKRRPCDRRNEAQKWSPRGVEAAAIVAEAAASAQITVTYNPRAATAATTAQITVLHNPHTAKAAATAQVTVTHHPHAAKAAATAQITVTHNPRAAKLVSANPPAAMDAKDHVAVATSTSSGELETVRVLEHKGRCLCVNRTSADGFALRVANCGPRDAHGTTMVSTNATCQDWLHDRNIGQLKSCGRCLDAGEPGPMLMPCSAGDERQGWAIDTQTGQIRSRWGDCLVASWSASSPVPGLQLPLLEPCDTGSRNQRWRVKAFQPARHVLSTPAKSTAVPPSAQQLGAATPHLRVNSTVGSNSTKGLSWPRSLNSPLAVLAVVPALLSVLLCGMAHGTLVRKGGRARVGLCAKAITAAAKQPRRSRSTSSNGTSMFMELPSFVAVPSAHSRVLLEPRTDVFRIPDPRTGAHPLRDVSVCIFGEDMDATCGCDFLDLDHNLGPYGGMVLDVAGVRRSFPTGRAALDALLAADDEGSEWDTTLVVQKAKFRSGSALDRALERTGDAFLLHRGTDTIWSDAGNGEGQNLLGMQLMLLRDFRNGWCRWTGFIEVAVDTQTGQIFNGPADAWQNVVRSAAHVAAQPQREALMLSRQGSRRSRRGSNTAAVASAGKASREDSRPLSNDDGLESSPLLR